jgi:hypothetical protein
MNKTELKRIKSTPELIRILSESNGIDSKVARILDLLCPIIPDSEQQRMVSTLCSVMDIDVTLNGARVARFASEIFKADGTPELVVAKYGPDGWYWDNDWKGKRGDPLTESDIRRTWGKWKSQVSFRKSYNPHTGNIE